MCKNLCYDFRTGTLKSKLSAVIMLFILLYGILCAKGITRQGATTLGDYIIGGIQGTLPFRSEITYSKYFEFPIRWFVLMVSLLASSLFYPLASINCFGQQIIIRSNKRRNWWYAKYLWSLLHTTLFFLIYCLELCILGLFYQAQPSFAPSSKFLHILLIEVQDYAIINIGGYECCIITFTALSALLILAALQLLINIVTQSITGFLISVSILCISSILFSKFLIGNYTMAIRSALILSTGLRPINGICLSIIGLVIIFACGLLYTGKKNWLLKS